VRTRHVDAVNGYQHYPSRERVLGWLSGAGLVIVEEIEGDDYWHLILQRDR
jgi:hypothetical protein